MNEKQWPSIGEISMSLPLTYDVMYTEYGYRIIGGGFPNEEELKKIKIESKKYMADCKKEHEKIQKIQSEFYQELWEIDHPFQVIWQKFKKWLKMKTKCKL